MLRRVNIFYADVNILYYCRRKLPWRWQLQQKVCFYLWKFSSNKKLPDRIHHNCFATLRVTKKKLKMISNNEYLIWKRLKVAKKIVIIIKITVLIVEVYEKFSNKELIRGKSFLLFSGLKVSRVRIVGF